MNKINFELNSLERNCSDEIVLKEIRRTANLISSQFITRKEFDKISKISSSTVVNRFKSWGNALSKAELKNRYSGLVISAKMRDQKGKSMTDEELIMELKSVAQKLKVNILTIENFNRHSSINAETIRRRFGSWGIALNKAGLKISNMGKRYSDDYYFENMLKVWTFHGRQPKYKEMDVMPSIISSGAYEAKWGSWRKSLIAFIERINSDQKLQAKNIIAGKQYLDSGKAKKHKHPNIRTIPLGLRYNVLKRDRFKCVLCGDSPATSPKIKLQVDHIMPFSQGGKAVQENLRTLCSDCNLGKSDKIE